MQVVINIDDKMYEAILDGWWPDTLLSVRQLVAKGTILPREHGRLGDLDKIYVALNEAQIEGTPEYKGIGAAKQMICDAPTIIEANKEEEISI